MLARDTPRAAQVAAMAPRSGMQAARPSVTARCAARAAGPAGRPLFLHFDNGFRAGQALVQLHDIALCGGEFGAEQIDRGGFGAAPHRAARAQHAAITLAAEIA